MYIVEATGFRQMWGAMAATVDAAEIDQIVESPFRLPVQWANALYQAGESGMGYTRFTARMRDGSTLPFVVGNCVDFPNWPAGTGPGDVLDVQPHAGREVFRDRVPGPHERSADYLWCVYEA